MCIHKTDANVHENVLYRTYTHFKLSIAKVAFVADVNIRRNDEPTEYM